MCCVTVIQSQDGWRVKYYQTDVCATKGSTVEIICDITHPYGIYYSDIKDRFWFTKEKYGEPVDLRTDSEYSGRVTYAYSSDWKSCYLTITDVRESDSAEYKLRFMTNRPRKKYTGSPGVTLSVTGFQVQVRRLNSTWLELTCHSSCVLSRRAEYVLYQNGRYFKTGSSLPVSSGSTDRYSCYLTGYWNQRSPAVYGPQRPSVSVSPSAEMLEGGSVTLTCSADANPAVSYTWYKEDGTSDPRLLSEEPQLVFSSIQSSDSGNYSCTAENQLGRKTSDFISINVKYGPQRPSVSVSPIAEMLEGGSVTLTCSTDANPAASYTWYKEDRTSDPHLLSKEPQLVFSSIQSSDSGRYSCTAENQLGRKTSDFILIPVKYLPQRPSVSVSPSAEILEGDSVTLTCSTDANPAASYTWYKGDGTSDPHLFSEEPQLVFSSVQSSDSGRYFCTAENQLGREMSDFISIDVKYGPQRPSVSVSPSAEMLEGGSVNLTCSTDANPAANYTWYKEHKDSPRASGQIFTINDFTAEHSGNYYCEAQNEMGRSNSTLRLITSSGASPWPITTAVFALTSAIFLVIIMILAVLMIRKKSPQSSRPAERLENNAQIPPAEPCYATASFSRNQEDLLLYSNVSPARPPRRKEEEVLYSGVNFESSGAASERRCEGAVDDSSALYSTVSKAPRE
ncbi:Fc receptor-like protein 2 isoform X3 [Gasterosteus aculeatus]